VANSNCLNGIQCPGCGSEGPFQIAAKCWVEVSDDGTDPFSSRDWAWDGSSAIVCSECGKAGRVNEFAPKNISG